MPAHELTPPDGAQGSPDEALDLLRSGRVEVLGRMPWSSNATLLVEVRRNDECLRAVYKPRRGERPLWDFPPGLDRREVAAFELSSWLGWDIIPETALRDDLPFGVGSLQRFVPFDVESHYFTLVEDELHHGILRIICTFDLVANSADRKGGHCIVGDDHRIYAVDNGLTFHHEPKLRTVIWDFGGQPIPGELLADLGRLADDGPDLDGLLDAAERAALRRRAAAVVTAGVFPIDETGRRYPWPLV